MIFQMAEVAIANARGVLGTLACVAWDRHNGSPVLLTTQHVLYGRGARQAEPIWHPYDYRRGHGGSPLGWSLWGKVGVIPFGGASCFVDCAIGSWARPAEVPLQAVKDWADAKAGQNVSKLGARTGLTRGVVDQSDAMVNQGRPNRGLHAPGQLLIRSLEHGQPFAAEGDSGALVVNENGQAVGLLWGVNSQGSGLASPIAAVLQAMHITLNVAVAPAAL